MIKPMFPASKETMLVGMDYKSFPELKAPPACQSLEREIDSYHVVMAPSIGPLDQLWQVNQEFECLMWELDYLKPMPHTCRVGEVLIGKLHLARNWRQEVLYNQVDVLGDRYGWCGVPLDCIEPLMKTVWIGPLHIYTQCAIAYGVPRDTAKGLSFLYLYGGRGMAGQRMKEAYKKLAESFQKASRAMAQSEVFARVYGRPET